jgi:O-acetyl-ADP-ribose deacetylase (regulator of RNase III)
MKIRYVKGELIEVAHDYSADAIAHGCNCFCTMGCGAAKRVNDYTRGQALIEDQKTICGDINKIGTYSSFWYEDFQFFNLYTQYVYANQIKASTNKCGKPPVLVHWMGVYEAMREMIENMDGEVVVIPEIGCGLANGRREHLERIISILAKEYENDKNLEIVVVEYGQ